MTSTINIIMRTLCLACAILYSLCAQAQSFKSGYFLPGMLNRHEINPAVANQYNFVGIPMLSNINLGVATNMGAATFFYPMPNGSGLTTFMNGAISASEVLSQLNPKNVLNASLSVDILSGGFIAGKSYQTITLSMRSFSSGNAPYELFDFMKTGMASAQGVTSYKIKDLSFESNNFAQLAWSYSRDINPQWRVGGKAKLLMGLANVQANIDNMDIEMSADKWRVTSQGQMNVSALMPLTFKTNENNAVNGVETGNGLNLSNLGFALDLGAVFKPIDRLTVSLGVTDLGFINWKKSISANTKADPFIFEGFTNIGGDVPLDSQIEDLKKQAQELVTFYPNAGQSSNSKMLKATINIGGEYEIFEDLFSVGLLSSTRIDPVFTITEAIVSANYRPTNSWFNAALTLDVSNIAVSGGAVINFCPEYFNLFMGVEFMMCNLTPQYLPMKNGAPRFAMGLNIPFGKKSNK